MQRDKNGPLMQYRICTIGIGSLLLFCSGTCISSDCLVGLFVRGRVIDADTMAPVPGALIGGRSFTNNEVTDHFPPTYNGSPYFPPTSADGLFQFDFSDLAPCQGYSFPRPDEIEIIVVRDGCEQGFTIAINADTVVDVNFPNDTLELKEPILVPACPEE